MLKPVYFAFAKTMLEFFLQTTHFVKWRAHSPRPTSKIIAMIALRRAILMKANPVVSLHAHRLFSGRACSCKKEPCCTAVVSEFDLPGSYRILQSGIMGFSMNQGRCWVELHHGTFWDPIAHFIGYYGVALDTGYSSPKAIPQCNSTQHRPSLIAISKPLIRHFHITHNAPCLLPTPKICLRIVFNLSWYDCYTQEKIWKNGYAQF